MADLSAQAGFGERETRREPGVGELRNGNYECFILGLSALSLLNIVLILLIRDPETRKVVLIVDAGLTVPFLADFAYRLFSARSKRGYFVGQQGWLDLIGSLPVPGLRLARLLHMARAARQLRGVGLRPLWRAALRDRAGSTLLVLVFLTVVLLEVASALMLKIERQRRECRHPHRLGRPVVDLRVGDDGGLRRPLPGDERGADSGGSDADAGRGAVRRAHRLPRERLPPHARRAAERRTRAALPSATAELVELRRQVRALQAASPRNDTAGTPVPD